MIIIDSMPAIPAGAVLALLVIAATMIYLTLTERISPRASVLWAWILVGGVAAWGVVGLAANLIIRWVA